MRSDGISLLLLLVCLGPPCGAAGTVIPPHRPSSEEDGSRIAVHLAGSHEQANPRIIAASPVDLPGMSAFADQATLLRGDGREVGNTMIPGSTAEEISFREISGSLVGTRRSGRWRSTCPERATAPPRMSRCSATVRLSEP